MRIDKNKIKDRIIANSIRLIYHGEDIKKIINEDISIFSKFYRIPNNRNVRTIEKEKALIQFIENKEGYLVTVPILKNAINSI